jgi:hypothetical protein
MLLDLGAISRKGISGSPLSGFFMVIIPSPPT